MKRAILFFVLLLATGTLALAQNPAPAPVQSKRIMIMNGTAHLGNGAVIQNSAIGFKDGKLLIVGDATRIKFDPSQYDTVINASGKHIYPGFIAVDLSIGLTEIGAVRATLDYNETGAYNPNVRALIAYNTDSKVLPTVRSNGVLMAQTTPRGGVISGSSSVMQLDAWNWEDAVIRADEGIHLNWPRMMTRTWTFDDGLGPVEKNKNYEKEAAELKKFFDDAFAYSKQAAPVEKNLRFEAMKGLFSGEKRLYIHTNFSREIMASVDFSKMFGLKKLTVVGGDDAYLVTDFLKANDVSVMIGKVHELPKRNDEDVDLPYRMPSILAKAGITYAIAGEGEMEAMNSRNLPFWAGTASAYGLDKEEALKAITLYPAQILGIDKFTGSLEEGKAATLFISDGDALDMLGNNVTMAFINGRKINLDDHQKELYRIYSKKYGK